MAVILDSSTVILSNIYLVMILQLALNWSNTACNTNSYLFQLGFILLMAARLIFHELHNNRVMNYCPFLIFSFGLSGLLFMLGIYQGVTVFTNPSDFYYDPTTKSGNQVCFQNRIVFVTQIVLIALTLVKDIYFALTHSKEDPIAVESQ